MLMKLLKNKNRVKLVQKTMGDRGDIRTQVILHTNQQESTSTNIFTGKDYFYN